MLESSWTVPAQAHAAEELYASRRPSRQILPYKEAVSA